MANPRVWIAAAIGAAAAAVAIAAVFITAGGGARTKASTHAQAPAPAQTPCDEALLHDWSDGRIDRAYPIRCYRAALKSLPADLEVYSSAPDDIAHALSRRILQSAKKGAARKLTR